MPNDALNAPMSINEQCPICESRDVREHLKTYDDRYGYPGVFTLMKCAKCGHFFLREQFSDAALQELYTRYYPRSELNIESYRPHVERSGLRAWLAGDKSGAFRWVPRDVTVLDIGCGFCESLGYHRNRGCDAYGVEADANARRVAERYGFNVHIGLFDAKDFRPAMFDYVTLSQVIEHVTDPLKTLRDIATVLKPGGVVVVSTPNAQGWGAKLFGRRWINWHTPYHLQSFSKASFELAAQKTGFEVVRDETVTSSNWLVHQAVHLAEYPNQGQPSTYWAPHARRAGRLRLLVRKTISGTKLILLPEILSRLMDALGFGDNRIILARRKS